jgi:hypothetical protein
MQGSLSLIPTEDYDACVPTAHERKSPHFSAGSRKVSKNAFPWDLPAVERKLALSQPQDEDEDIQEKKRPRLEEPFSAASTNEGTTKCIPHYTWAAIPRSGAAAAVHADSDPVMELHPKMRTTGAPRHWTLEEYEKLTSALQNTCKKKRG